MPRVKRSVSAKKKRRVVLARAKGYYGAKSRHYKKAKEQVRHSLQYQYRDRRNKSAKFAVCGSPVSTLLLASMVFLILFS